MYAHKANDTITVYQSLPKNWKNVSGLNLLTDIAELKSLGWYKVVLDTTEYDINIKEISHYDYTYDINRDEVVQSAVLVDKPIPSEEQLEEELRIKRSTMICSNYQARQALVLSGLYNAVESAMNDPNVDISAKLAWEYSATFYRISPFITAIASSLGLSEDDIDNLFITAMNIGI